MPGGNKEYFKIKIPIAKIKYWSKINKQHIEKPLAANLLAPAGVEAIEAAKKNASWTARRCRRSRLLDDLQKAFDSNKKTLKY